MATTATPVTIGPFAGGINSSADSAAIQDDECRDIVNFDIDIDGSLISRPPIWYVYNAADNRNIRLLGNYHAPDGKVWLIFSAINGDDRTKSMAYDPVSNTITTISLTFAPTAMVQYQNKAWLISPPNSDNPGGSWDGVTFTPIPAMKKGVSAVVYKERIFVGSGSLATNPSRVYFSGAANPTSWTDTDFFDVNNGDGEDLVKLFAFSGAIAVFKENSTYMFAYESAPAKGQVQKVSATVGADNPDAVVELDNRLYAMCDAKVYEITNWNWELINPRVPFRFVNAHYGKTRWTSSLSAVGKRIIARYYDSYYVFGTETSVWSRWETILTPDTFIKYPLVDAGTGIEVYYGGNMLSVSDGGIRSNELYCFKDAITELDKENFTCLVRTKTYGLGTPYSFKRLMWWGVDLLAATPVNARLIPVSYGYPVKWKAITAQNLTWNDRKNYTWNAPLTLSLDVTDTANVSNYTNVRMFIKFIKSIRFRQVQFQLSSNVDGSTRTGPLRIFSLVAFVSNRETVTKKIS